MPSAVVSEAAGYTRAEVSSQSVDTAAPVPVAQLMVDPAITIDVP